MPGAHKRGEECHAVVGWVNQFKERFAMGGRSGVVHGGFDMRLALPIQDVVPYPVVRPSKLPRYEARLTAQKLIDFLCGGDHLVGCGVAFECDKFDKVVHGGFLRV